MPNSLDGDPASTSVPPPAADAANPDAPASGESETPSTVSLAAVTAGAAGAALGALGGLMGAVVGAVTGAFIAKETMEAAKPTEDAGAAGKQPTQGEFAPPEPPHDEPLPPAMPLAPAPDSFAFLGGGAPEPLLQNVAAGALGDDEPDTAPAPPPAPKAPPAAAELPVDLDVPPPSPPSSRVSGRLQRFTFPAPLVAEVTVSPAYPEEEEVRAAAYYRYLDRHRHGAQGDEVSDWVAAEQEVRRG